MTKTIGTFGLTFNSGNMGCSALAYSFLYLLDKCTNTKIHLLVFNTTKYNDIGKFDTKHIKCESFGYSYRSMKSMYNMNKQLNKCDVIFDFTEGDSFSDIYGFKTFLKVSLVKLFLVLRKKKLILGPQTYGPYDSIFAKILAKYIIRHCYYICTRDDLSAILVNKLTGKAIDIYTDVAFALPYTKYNIDGNKLIKIGLNISGLLWSGGYKGKNQFMLTLDYKKYIKLLLEILLKDKEYQVYLIPHVITKDYNNIENDLAAAKIVNSMYPKAIMSPIFNTPIEAKGFIANMDIFIGSRMHATIAAFSSGVATIPVSYSKKFEGLYNGLGYYYVISAKIHNTEEALNKTIEYIQTHSSLKQHQESAIMISQNRLSQFMKICSNLIESQ